jgi:hypothetical protein
MLFRGMTVAALALLAACSSDPTPVEPDPTPSTSATPTIAVPTAPAQASEDSPEGAAAFVKHYVDVFNYAAATGDVDELSRLSSPDCTGCQSYIDLYRDTYEAGGYFKGGDWKLGDLRVKYGTAETYLTTTITSDPSRYRDTKADPEKQDPGEDSTVSFGAARTSGSWLVTQMGLGAVK